MNFLKNIFSKIKTSYFKSLRGEENFWIVLFGWGVFLYTTAILSIDWSFKILVFTLNHSPTSIIITEFICLAIIAMIFIWGIIIIFLYPIFFIYILIKFAIKNVDYKLLALILISIFLWLHYITYMHLDYYDFKIFSTTSVFFQICLYILSIVSFIILVFKNDLINLEKKYWEYGFKKFLFYTIFGLIVSNIPFPAFGLMLGAWIPVLISALMISITDTLQLRQIDLEPEFNRHIVFSSRYKKLLSIIFFVVSLYFFGLMAWSNIRTHF